MKRFSGLSAMKNAYTPFHEKYFEHLKIRIFVSKARNQTSYSKFCNQDTNQILKP